MPKNDMKKQYTWKLACCWSKIPMGKEQTKWTKMIWAYFTINYTAIVQTWLRTVMTEPMNEPNG